MMLLGVTLNRDLHAATQEWCVGCGGNASLACAESFEDATKVGQLGITLGQLLTFGFQIRLAKWHCHSTPQLIIRPEPERHTDSRSTLFLLFNPTVHYFTPPTAHHRPHTTDCIGRSKTSGEGCEVEGRATVRR